MKKGKEDGYSKGKESMSKSKTSMSKGSVKASKGGSGFVNTPAERLK